MRVALLVRGGWHQIRRLFRFRHFQREQMKRNYTVILQEQQKNGTVDCFLIGIIVGCDSLVDVRTGAHRLSTVGWS